MATKTSVKCCFVLENQNSGSRAGEETNRHSSASCLHLSVFSPLFFSFLLSLPVPFLIPPFSWHRPNETQVDFSSSPVWEIAQGREDRRKGRERRKQKKKGGRKTRKERQKRRHGKKAENQNKSTTLQSSDTKSSSRASISDERMSESKRPKSPKRPGKFQEKAKPRRVRSCYFVFVRFSSVDPVLETTFSKL